MPVYGSKTKDIQKIVVNILLTVKMELKNLVHSKPFMKIIGILLLIVRLGKSSDQTIIQIIRENKSILFNPINVSQKRI